MPKCTLAKQEVKYLGMFYLLLAPELTLREHKG